MTVSREQIQRKLDAFELEMRIVAATYVTTERFLKDFLRQADKLSRKAPTEDHEWVSAQISQILLKFGFKDDRDTLS